MDACLKQMKVIGRKEDVGKKRIPVSRGHRDKGLSERFALIFIQIDTEWAEDVRKSRLSYK